MYKLLTANNLSPQTQAKCGEIYCNSYLDLTIYCTFCDVRYFAYDDFKLHVQNVHFGIDLLGTEDVLNDCKETSEGKVKNKHLIYLNEPENEEKEIVDFSDDDNNDIVMNNCRETSNGKVKNNQLIPQNEPENKAKEILDISDNDLHDNDTIYISSEEEETLSFIKVTKRDVLKNHRTETINIANINNVIEKPLSANTKSSVQKIKNTELFSCPECKEQFLHKKYLDSHVYDVHNGYKCTLCDKRFRLRHHLNRHIRIHTAEKKFHCTIENCGRSFTNEQYLKHHLEVHTVEKTFICNFENCGKAFPTQRRLLAHNYTHMGPKKLICDTCGYTCRANLTLIIHQRVHTGERPFACAVCRKHFMSRTALNVHMVTHSKTRPHVCKICNATFANLRILQRHLYIHSDDRKFKCKLCDSSFKQPHGLDGHMRRMHLEPKHSSIIVNNVTQEVLKEN